MAAITLTPVDISTAPVVVNAEILYHVFTINGVTRVFYGKGGKIPYQIDVQESAAAIAALCPNLVEVTTVNGTEYLFIGSGGAGPGLGIMFIEDDGSGGSKITFRYTEESGNTMFYSSDSPSVIAGRINAQANPTPSAASYEVINQASSFQDSVNMTTDKAIINTVSWTYGTYDNSNFTVYNPLITASSILKVYLSDSNASAKMFITPVKNNGFCELYFSTGYGLTGTNTLSIILEVIN
jgi:hypothetical protein